MKKDARLWLKAFAFLVQEEKSDSIISDFAFHYTNCDGVMGIIKPNKKLSFWFTRSDCLNDTSEGKYIKSIFQTACNELLEKEMIDKKFYNLIFEVEIKSNDLLIYPKSKELINLQNQESEFFINYADCDDYICCFSFNDDSLEMWRYYSKSSVGYALKMSPLVFYNYEDHNKSDTKRMFSNLHCYEVVYSKEKQINITKECIMLINKAYMDSGLTDSRNRLAIQCVEAFFKKYRYRFKHECFSSEKELRFVYKRPRVKPDNMDNPLPEVKYRNQGGTIVPYIELEVESADNYLNGILISPLVKEENVVKRTLDFIQSRGFSTIDIKQSELPVRF